MASKSPSRVARWRCVPNTETGRLGGIVCSTGGIGVLLHAVPVLGAQLTVLISLCYPPQPISPQLLSLSLVSSPPPLCPCRIHTLCRGAVVGWHQGVCPILPPLRDASRVFVRSPPPRGDASTVFVPSLTVTPTPVVPSHPPPPR